jgi:uncharacterized membrane protein YhhN
MVNTIATLFCIYNVGLVAHADQALAQPDVRAHALSALLDTRRRRAMMSASLAFVVIGLSGMGNGAFAHWMIAGLVISAIGDIALLGKGSRAFLLGLVAFLMGHIAYLAGLACVVPPSRWLEEAGGYAAMPILVAAVALYQLRGRLGILTGPVLVYVAVMVVMVIAAFAARHHVSHGKLLTAGATLLFLSDLSPARERADARAFTNRLHGVLAYYAGQLLIAWAIA